MRDTAGDRSSAQGVVVDKLPFVVVFLFLVELDR